MKVHRDLVGEKFGKLTVIRNTENRQYRDSLWECLCDCGTIKVVAGRHLRHDRTKSCGCNSKLPEGQAALRLIYRSYKRKAQDRNLEFLLTMGEFENFTKQDCHYCGRPPSTSAQGWSANKLNGDYIFNGIDRRDNLAGYTLKNSLTCCTICNRAKSDMVYEDFVVWIRRIKNNEIFLKR